MKAVRFKESTGVLGAPKGWDEEKHGPCSGLPVFIDEDYFISCWRPSMRERIRILFGRPLWLYMHSRQHPPVALSVARTVFK